MKRALKRARGAHRGVVQRRCLRLLVDLQDRSCREAGAFNERRRRWTSFSRLYEVIQYTLFLSLEGA